MTALIRHRAATARNQDRFAAAVRIAAADRQSVPAVAHPLKGVGVGGVRRQAEKQVVPLHPVAVGVTESGRAGVGGQRTRHAAGDGENPELIRLRPSPPLPEFSGALPVWMASEFNTSRFSRRERLARRIGIVREVIEPAGSGHVFPVVSIENVVRSWNRMGGTGVGKGLGAEDQDRVAAKIARQTE